jgi:hypothetical protein
MLYVYEETGNNLFWYSPKRSEELYSDTGGLLTHMICELNNEEERINVTDYGVLTKCTWKGMPTDASVSTPPRTTSVVQ